ncbi:thioredoxin reductase [Fusobacterium ulcerans]|uniref:Thioredoxin reductase n=1 Tax=Fusobacterium ulcerans TaxID=861 RepID=A0AAX2J8M8_9FUSO|nr:FAD-dependent oxidoreductase [Fusobacterium ulcerans]AVQ28303.1 thioredoxin reductase [Fusobacterium ulcerans]EFS25771.1 putative alkyl hydroperoxide reductase F subunit [Fusobacterium ulcerans ATCC 49185]SQJ00101.1 Thioredoxin reductase [Fusobacterium ulcerans]
MERIYDLIVIGGGPSGLSAGIYAGRAMMDVLIIEKDKAGGQICLTNEIVNYPGITEISGSEFGAQLKKQAESFGVEFISDEVKDMNFSQDIKTVKTSSGEYKALSVVLATGASPRKLNFPGEEEYTGRGVAYCATCDGEFFTGMEVFVVGAGFAAAEEAIFLTKYATKVTIIAREPEFTCAKSIAEKVLNHPKIEVRFNTELLEAKGDIQLRSAVFKNNVTEEISEYKAKDGKSFGIFIFVGYEPQSKLFKNHIELDQYGFIPTDEDLQTNVKGVYAAGDIRPKKLRQLVTAVSDGAVAAVNIEKYVHDLREKLGLTKEEKESKSTSHAQVKEVELLDSSLKEQLGDIVSRFENNIELVVVKDSAVEKSSMIEAMVKEISSVSDKLKFSSFEKGENPELEKKIKADRFPTIAILDKNGDFSGVKFSSLPSGHELNSFILAMYNIAGPGQKISDDTMKNIQNISSPVSIKIGISLSCTKCPETVQAAQKIAIENKNVNVEVIDVFTFPDFKEKYDIMSVPAMIINDKDIFFGQKNIDEVIETLM